MQKLAVRAVCLRNRRSRVRIAPSVPLLIARYIRLKKSVGRRLPNTMQLRYKGNYGIDRRAGVPDRSSTYNKQLISLRLSGDRLFSKQPLMRPVAHPVTHENSVFSSRLLCAALSGLFPCWDRSPGLTPWAGLRRRFAAQDAQHRRFRTEQPRAVSPGMRALITKALKGRGSKAQGVSPGMGARVAKALKGRRRIGCVGQCHDWPYFRNSFSHACGAPVDA